MNALAEKFSSEKVGSYFLYTHEAHPGENYPHLTDMEQKFRHAQALRDVYSVTRPILIDSLDGACHRYFGSMPNMGWIFSSAGFPVYKSDWTDHYSLENALQYFLEVENRRQDGNRLGPYLVERLDYRNIDREGFIAGLERNGPKAVREYEGAY